MFVEMSWRELERLWQSDPNNPHFIEAYRRSLERARRPVPQELLENKLFTARQLILPFQLSVGVDHPIMGPTIINPSKFNEHHFLYELPICRHWWVHLQRADPALHTLIDLLNLNEVPTLLLENRDVSKFSPGERQLHTITEIQLANCQGISALFQDARVFPTLRKLYIDGESSKKQSFLERLPQFSTLQTLGLEVSTEPVAFNSPSLRELELSCRLLPPRWKAVFPGFQSLQTLRLDCGEISVTALESLETLPRLKQFEVVGRTVQFDDDLLATIARCRRLEALRIDRATRLTDRGLQHLPGLHELRKLALKSGSHFNLRAFQHISKIEKLNHLNLSGNFELDHSHLSALSPAQPLETFILYDCHRISNRALETLSRFKNLKKLNLHNCYQITNKGIAALKAMGNLRELNLAGNQRFSNAGLTHLRHFYKLSRFSASSCPRITAQGFKKLIHLPFEDVNLWGGVGIKDEGLEYFESFEALKKLNLSFSSISDLGLKTLRTLKGLQVLSLSHCPKITRMGVKALRAAIPHCSVFSSLR